MSERQSDPWKQFSDELGQLFLQSFREEIARESSTASRPAKDTLETLAAHAHDEQWSDWIDYMFGKGHENEDGSLTIPASWYWRWKYQAQTPYAQLPEDMKESDREEARRILRLLEDGE